MSDESGGENPFLHDPPTDFRAVERIEREAAREQVADLREAIRHHDRRYYVDADPEIADRTYDALFERLRRLEEAFEMEAETSPTARVGGPVADELDTVEHVAPMLSIDSSGDADDVRAFAEGVRDRAGPAAGGTGGTGNAAGDGDSGGERTLDEYGTGDGGEGDTESGGERGEANAGDESAARFVCEPKFDGISVEVVYEEGEYVRAATRGDGERGEDITENVRVIPSIPSRLADGAPDFLAVRAEIFMPREAFREYNADRVARDEDPFANPRNAVAGTVRQLDSRIVAERPLSCFFFDTVDSSRAFETRTEMYDLFREWGLRVTDRIETTDDIEQFVDYRDALLDERDDLPYEVDGAVVKVNDIDTCDRLGATSRAPRWAFAHKLPARSGETPIRSVTVQIGRTGRATPVAMLSPVDVGGVTVSRASLHNPVQMGELGVGPGDVIEVARAGDVIPHVEGVVTSNSGAKTFDFPDRCPACDSAIERDGPLAYCTGGTACPRQLVGALAHYASRSALDIEGLGDERVEQLVETDTVESVPDLYDLDPGELADMEGWGERSAENLVAELRDKMTPPLSDFLVALGIPDVGPTTARALAREFGSVEALADADEESLRAVDDIGPAVAEGIWGFFADERNRETVDRLLDEAGIRPRAPAETGGDALDGLTFVFTGTLSEMTREEAETLVERHGANATGSVSGNTDRLVAGENPGASKTNAAAEEGVPRLDERGFRDLLAEAGIEAGAEATS